MPLTPTEHAELTVLIGEAQTAHLNLGLYSNPAQYDREDFDTAVIALTMAQRVLDAHLKGLVEA